MVGTWAGRIPAVAERLELSWGALGNVLLVSAVGSVLMTPVSPWIVDRYGTRVAARAWAVIALAGLGGVGLAPSVPVLVIALVTLACGLAVWDVAMNVEGGRADRRQKMPVLIPLHGCFSVGALAGALLSACMAQLKVPVGAHLVAVATFVALVEWRATRMFSPSRPATDAPDHQVLDPHWRRYLAFGLIALAVATAEVIGNDWIALLQVDDYGHGHSAAAAVLVVFLTAMAVGRFAAVLVVHPTLGLLRVSVVGCIAGILLMISPIAAGIAHTNIGYSIAILAAVVWGLGAAAALPWAMHMAGRNSLHAASRVRTVQAMSTFAFISPFLVGQTADRSNEHTTAFLGVALVLSVLAAVAWMTLRVRSRPAATPGTPVVTVSAR